jgi:hypothetical protein
MSDFIRHKQGILTRLTPHQGNNKFLKTFGYGGRTDPYILITRVTEPGCCDALTGPCTQQVTYSATLYNYEDPFSYNWSISGPGTIIGSTASQTVVVETTSSTNVSIVLTCRCDTAPDEVPITSREQAFIHCVTEGAPAAFLALVPDETTYEMLGVDIGVGGLTATHTADIYAPDFDGVYQKFPANAPVWSGGRCVLSAGAGSDVTAVYADDGTGTPLAEMPYLDYVPAATNMNTYNSRDLTGWAQNGSASSTYDQVGLDGSANSATESVFTGGGDFISKVNIVGGIPGDTTIYTFVYWIKKGTGTTRVRWFGVGGTPQNLWETLDLDLGTITSAGVTAAEALDVGGWYKVMLQHANNGTNTTLDSGIGLVANTITSGNVEVHAGKTIAQVRGLPPIFTTTAPVSTDAVLNNHDTSNSSDISSAWYFEVNGIDGAQSIVDGFLAVVGTDFQLSDGTTTATQPYTNGAHKIGINYFDAQMAINVDGGWSADVSYDSTMLQGALDYFRAGGFSGQIRNERRYNITSYAEGKTIIDGLMA